jgi:D-alanyl-D-alanine carboxypeptidase
MTDSQPMTPMVGTVTTTARLNIRKGLPSTSAPIATKVEAGVVLAVQGLVRGEGVHGNADWYAALDDTFFWSGAAGAFQPSDGAAGAAVRVHRRPNGTIRPLSEAEIRLTFGNIVVTEAGGGRVNLNTVWINENITNLPSAWLADAGFRSIQVHIKARDPFTRAFTAAQQAGLTDRILTCAGTFVPRHKGWNVNRGLSSHTWGIAIDLNVAWNGYGSVPAALGTHGSVRELVPIFEAEGFAWGGYFEPLSICDGMHFELARLDV